MSRLIFFDIDDTLCRMGALPSNNFNTLKALHQAGHRLAIATGRSFATLPKDICRLFDLNMISALITANGQVNRVGAEVVSRYPLPYADVAKMVALCRDWGLDYQLASEHHLAWSAQHLRDNALTHAFPALVVDPNYHERHTIYQLSVFLPIEAQNSQVESAFAQMGYRLVRWHRGGADVIPVAGSKARGIQDVCRVMAVDMSQTIAFGDGLNDIEMLKEVGIGVAMGDGWEAVKSVADYVTGTIEEDGILKALQHFKLLGE